MDMGKLLYIVSLLATVMAFQNCGRTEIRAANSGQGGEMEAASGNGSGYNGKISYTETVEVGICPDSSKNIKTQIDVTLISGRAVSAELVRENCEVVPNVPLQLGSQVVLNDSLTVAAYGPINLAGTPPNPAPPQQSPHLPEPPMAFWSCSGTSMSSGKPREVFFQASPNSDGTYTVDVSVRGIETFRTWRSQVQMARSGEGFYQSTNPAGIFQVDYMRQFIVMAPMMVDGGQPEQISEQGQCAPQ